MLISVTTCLPTLPHLQTQKTFLEKWFCFLRPFLKEMKNYFRPFRKKVFEKWFWAYQTTTKTSARGPMRSSWWAAMTSDRLASFLFFKNGPFPASFFFIFVFSIHHNHCPLASFLISFRGHLFWMSFCVEIKKDGQWQLHIYLPTTRPMCTYLHRDQSFWSLPMGAIRFQRILTCVKCGMADLLFYSFGFNQTSKYVEHLNTTKQLNSNQWNRRSSIQWHFP